MKLQELHLYRFASISTAKYSLIMHKISIFAQKKQRDVFKQNRKIYTR
jgi:hypothetical protein